MRWREAGLGEGRSRQLIAIVTADFRGMVVTPFFSGLRPMSALVSWRWQHETAFKRSSTLGSAPDGSASRNEARGLVARIGTDLTNRQTTG